METIGVYEAKNKLSSMIDQILEGEEITITRRGEEVARLVPIIDAIDQQQTRAAASRIVKRSGSIRRGGLDTEALRTAGQERRP
jgi:prevent-host-death family protein